MVDAQLTSQKVVYVYVPETPVVPYGAVYCYYPGGAIDCRIIYMRKDNGNA
jgi:hypothetical protein